MPILITGGAGLLGAAVVRLLLDIGEIRPVVMDISKAPDRLTDVLDQTEYITADLGNFNKMLSVIQKAKPNVIYHIGAILGQACEEDPAEAIRINALGTFNILEAARLFQIPKVLFASSAATFGLDMQDSTLTDNSLQRPATFYGVTKLFSEGTGLFFKRKYGIDFRSVRYPSIVGPGAREGGVVNYTSAMIEESARGNPYTVNVAPETKVSIVYTHDAARAMVELAEAPAENIKSQF